MSKTIKSILYISLTLNLVALLLFQQDNIFRTIKDFFKSTIHPRIIQTNDLKAISIYNDNITINGLPFLSKGDNLNRLPKEMKNKISPILWELGTQPSGGRIRFKTNSKTIAIVAESSSFIPYHMTSIMKNGLDIYINNVYSGSAWPDSNGKIKKQFQLEDDNIKNITIYLPLYASIKIGKLYVEKNAGISKANDLLKIDPIIYYGSSITQGASASNPGLSYEAIISRKTKIDFINFGFSANGLGDIKMAELISSLDSSLIVLDYWANPTSQQYKKSLPQFVDTIRRKRKNIPILIITPFYSVGLKKQQIEKKKIVSSFIHDRKESGDKHIYMLDGTKMLSKENSFGLVDGLHLNSLGFWFSANALEPEILKIINAPEI